MSDNFARGGALVFAAVLALLFMIVPASFASADEATGVVEAVYDDCAVDCDGPEDPPPPPEECENPDGCGPPPPPACDDEDGCPPPPPPVCDDKDACLPPCDDVGCYPDPEPVAPISGGGAAIEPTLCEEAWGSTYVSSTDNQPFWQALDDLLNGADKVLVSRAGVMITGFASRGDEGAVWAVATPEELKVCWIEKSLLD